MNKIIAIIVFGIVAACAGQGTRYKNNLSEEERARFHFDQQYVYYDSVKVARFGNIEYEYYRGHKVMEISLEQLKPGMDDFTDKIVDYVRYKNPKAKVEVKIPAFPLEGE